MAPKKTMLFSGVALKLVPEMVTIEPVGPLAGVKEVITGTSAIEFTLQIRNRGMYTKIVLMFSLKNVFILVCYMFVFFKIIMH